MPEASSMIRTVPGANVGPDGADAAGAEERAPSVLLLERPATSASTSTTTSPSTESPTTHAGGNDRGAAGTADGTPGSRPAAPGGLWTATPGPAGVVTSDQPAPFHQRT